MDFDQAKKNFPLNISIQLQFGSPQHFETELIEAISEPYFACTRSSEVLLTPLIDFLKVIGYPLEKSLIWYFSTLSRQNIYSGTDPLHPTASVPLCEIAENTLCIICSRPLAAKKFLQLGSGPQDSPTPRKSNERRIGYIIEKVSKWRSLYNGVAGPTGNTVKLTSEEAANRVSISKKSLDDYLLQLRFGRKFGFNFEEHRDERIGILRGYVKKMKPLVAQNCVALQEPGTPVCKDSLCCQPFRDKERGCSLSSFLEFT